MDEFDYLLNVYLNRTAAPAERARLLALLRSGRYDDRIAKGLSEELEQVLARPVPEAERRYFDELYDTRIREAVKPPGKIKTVARHRWMGWAAVAMIVVAAGFWQLNRDSGLISVQTGPEVVRFQDKQFVRLPDSSRVFLNEGSELTFDRIQFGKSRREVTLTGEAFFEVTSDPVRPFLVHTGEVLTTVLGTSFNVRRMEGSTVRVTVTKGKVKVGSADGKYELLSANEEVTVNAHTNDFVKKETNASGVAEWKDEFLILDNVTMQEARALIEKRFHIKLRLGSDRTAGCHISASFFNNESLDHVLQVIATVNGFDITRLSDDTIRLDGGEACQ